MKDLYKQLGVEPGASSAELASAIEQSDDSENAAAVLLDLERRKLYDHSHATLKAIGSLRHLMNLETESSWFAENCPDFVTKPRSAAPKGQSKPAGSTPAGHRSGGENQESAAETVDANAQASDKRPESRKQQNMLLLIIVGTLLVTIAATWVVLL